MKKVLLTLGFVLVASVSYGQTNPNVSCDAAGTTCTVKKNGPFVVTADLYTDTLATKMRLYVDGVKTQEQPINYTTPPAFTMNLAVLGPHTIFMEAVGTCVDASNAQVECATQSANTVSATVINGNPKAPVNVRIVK